MQIRKAAVSDLGAIEALYEAGRQYMRANGNRDQWIGGYPSRALLTEDIRQEQLYLLIDDDETPAGVFAFPYQPDPTYAEIRDGAWLTKGPYAALHRITVSAHRRGLAGFIVREMAEQARQKGMVSVRVDTYRANLPMQHVLEKNGFVRCGIISLTGDFDDPIRLRIAYEKVL